MREEQTLRARRLEGRDGLVEGEVAARLAVELATEERRFTDEQVGIAGSFDKLVGRRRVSRVRDHTAVRLDAEGVGLEPCSAGRGSRVTLELAGEERRVRLVLREPERPLEHVREAEAGPELVEELRAARLHPELRLRHLALRREVEAAPDPRHEIAPVVEVEVRDRDRVDVRPLR